MKIILPNYILIFFMLFGVAMNSQTSSNPNKMFEFVSSKKTPNESFQKFQLFKSETSSARTNYADAVSDGVVIEFDTNGVANLLDTDVIGIQLEIPINSEGRTVLLDLVEEDVFSNDFQIKTSDGRNITNTIDIGKHFRGVIVGDAKSLVSISVFRNEIIGFIANESGNYVIGKLADSTTQHIVYNDKDLLQEFYLNCDTPDDDGSYAPQQLVPKNTTISNCVNVYIESGNSVYNGFSGNLTNTTNFLIGSFAQSYVLYANEGIPMKTSDMFIWTTPDPYSGTNSSEQLQAFQNNTSSINADIGHLVELQNIGGVAAGFNGVCNPNVNQSLCFSGYNNINFNDVPIYSFNVYIITHEMGHLLGSRHTHACVWNGNNTAIDGCSGFTEGSCAIPGSPVGGGTIMSYCHNDPVGVNFTEGFHPQPSAVINSIVNDQNNCLSSCSDCTTAAVPVNLTVSQITNVSARIAWDPVDDAIFDVRYRQSGTATWTLVPDIVATSIVLDNLILLTDYEVQVRSKCSNGFLSDFSESLFFTTLEFTYCDSIGNFVTDEYISRVQFASIDNTSTNENGGYSDFTNISTVVVAGEDYTITITPAWTSSVFPEGYAVWIDYNQNGSFTDAGELVYSQPATTATSVSGNINIPSLALEGSTRMRVSMKYNGVPAPCETFDFGEVEDYTVTINEVTCTGPVYSGNGNTGFGDVVGNSTLNLSDDGTTITGTFTKGAGDFNDAMVMYISTGKTGRNIIDNQVNDDFDRLRTAISSAGDNASDIAFPAGFEATYAIGIELGFGGLWSIPPTGVINDNDLNFIRSVGNPVNATDANFQFSFDWADLGLSNKDEFSFVITYLNANNGFLSDEAYGDGITPGNPGAGNITFIGSRDYPEYFYTFDGTTWSPSNPNGVIEQCRRAELLSGTAVFSTTTALKAVKVNPTAILDLDADLFSDIIFKSDASGSAQLNDATGIAINGDITIERYIPAKRAFRFVSSSVNSTENIRTNWQEAATAWNDNPSAGFGTHITGVSPDPNVNANPDQSQDGDNGFDWQPSGNSSLFLFNSTSQSWNAIANTDVNNLEVGKGYRLMVRGDRGINLTSNGSEPSNTVLRAKGDLVFGPVDVSTDLAQGADEFSLVGNPYQAVVDFSSATKTNLRDYVYVWDATLTGNNGRGAYVVVEVSSNAIVEAPAASSSSATKFIAPNQAFFVRNTSAGNPTLIFNEGNKATTADQVEVFSTYSDFYINSRLYKTEDLLDGNTEVDAIGLRFSESFTTLGDEEDPEKLANPDENYAIINNGLRAIDKQDLPTEGQEIALFINGYLDTNYSLTFDMENQPDGLSVFLEDNYLNTQTQLSQESVYAFNVDASVPESRAYNRFKLIFETGTLSNTNFEEGSVSLYPNPASEVFYISGLTTTAQVQIYDVFGKLLLTKEEVTNQLGININNLSVGMYLVKVNEGSETYTYKMIKK